MKSTICALNSELAEAKKMLADNHMLVNLGAQFSKLMSINKQPPSLAADIFYAMAKAVMSKVSPESVSLGGGLIVAVLVRLGIPRYLKGLVSARGWTGLCKSIAKGLRNHHDS